MEKARWDIVWWGRVVGTLEAARFEAPCLCGRWSPASDELARRFVEAIQREDEIEVELRAGNGPVVRGAVEELRGSLLAIRESHERL